MWKSLGDSLIKQSSYPVTSQPRIADIVDLSVPATDMASALERAYLQRFDKVRAARRAYAASVHINPARAASWSDLALTQHQEGVLMNEHPTLHDNKASQQCSVLAERVMLGALKLAPDVGGLWSALGSINVGLAKQEYALRRALQIDSSDAHTWLKLGRLYHSSGAKDLVKVC